MRFATQSIMTFCVCRSLSFCVTVMGVSKQRARAQDEKNQSSIHTQLKQKFFLRPKQIVHA